MGTEFGWPSADLLEVMADIIPEGQDKLRAKTGANSFLDYRSQIKNPDYSEYLCTACLFSFILSQNTIY